MSDKPNFERLGMIKRGKYFYRTDDPETPYTLEPISNVSFGEMFVPAGHPSATIVVTAISQPSAARWGVFGNQSIATGYSNRCPECGDILPDNARFCISCAAPVANTGKTERL